MGEFSFNLYFFNDISLTFYYLLIATILGVDLETGWSEDILSTIQS